MKRAILFWCYKNVNVCVNRLRLLRRYNPEAAIYCLYGGPREQAEGFYSTLGPYLNDFYDYPEERNSKWKWLNGDLMIADWYGKRGKLLSWDTLIVVQWDMLIVGSIDDVFSELGKDELWLSGLRPVDEVSSSWYWVTGKNRKRYDSYIKHLRESYDFAKRPMCCLFVVACLPRSFLQLYEKVEQRELGFLEYRLPTYAQVFKIRFCPSERFKRCWSEGTDRSMRKHQRVLNAKGRQVPITLILFHLFRRNGFRVFHPFDIVFPLDVWSALVLLPKSLSPSRLYKNLSVRTARLVSKRTGRTLSGLGRSPH